VPDVSTDQADPVVVIKFWESRPTTGSMKKRPRCEDDEESEPGEVFRIKNNVYFYAPVNTTSLVSFVKTLHSATTWARKNGLRVFLYLHSEGGSVFDAFSMCDHIRQNPVDVVTVADGFVASAATFVLLCGAERWALPETTLLIHELRTNFWGQYAHLVDEMANSEQLMERIKALYLAKSKLDAKRLDDLIKKELHLGAATALSYGLVDRIVGPEVR